jgi:glycosyltransferase involved in cell wall biosynthesis
MKTVQVVRRLVPDAWGGIETVVVSTVRELARRGHPTRLHATSALSRPGPDVVEDVPLVRHRYAYLRLPPRPGLRRTLDRKGGNPLSPGLVAALLAEPGVDLYVSHSMGRLATAVRFAARLRGVPYVVFIHGGHADVSPEEQQDLRALYRGTVDPIAPLDRLVGSARVLRDAAAVITLGRGEYEKLTAALPGTPVHLLPNGVDAARFAAAADGDAAAARAWLGVRPGARLLLCVARLDPQKGQHVLLAAAEHLATAGLDLHVALVGHATRPDHVERLRRTAAAGPLAGRVSVVEGLRFSDPRLPALYRAADVFVLPSLHEPFGIVILEAWAAHRPVVASRVGGIPSFAGDGESALLVPPGDAAALADGVARVLHDPALSGALAAAGADLVRERYDWTRVTDRLLAVYQEAAARRR